MENKMAHKALPVNESGADIGGWMHLPWFYGRERGFSFPVSGIFDAVEALKNSGFHRAVSGSVNVGKVTMGKGMTVASEFHGSAKSTSMFPRPVASDSLLRGKSIHEPIMDIPTSATLLNNLHPKKGGGQLTHARFAVLSVFRYPMRPWNEWHEAASKKLPLKHPQIPPVQQNIISKSSGRPVFGSAGRQMQVAFQGVAGFSPLLSSLQPYRTIVPTSGCVGPISTVRDMWRLSASVPMHTAYSRRTGELHLQKRMTGVLDCRTGRRSTKTVEEVFCHSDATAGNGMALSGSWKMLFRSGGGATSRRSEIGDRSAGLHFHAPIVQNEQLIVRSPGDWESEFEPRVREALWRILRSVNNH